MKGISQACKTAESIHAIKSSYIRAIYSYCYADLLKCPEQNVSDQSLTQVSQHYVHVSFCFKVIRSWLFMPISGHGHVICMSDMLMVQQKSWQCPVLMPTGNQHNIVTCWNQLCNLHGNRLCTFHENISLFPHICDKKKPLCKQISLAHSHYRTNLHTWIMLRIELNCICQRQFFKCWSIFE